MTCYELAVKNLYSLGRELQDGTPRKFELAHMRILSEALGSPQRNFPSVLIAGTNGKGSTAATLASILQAASYRVGLYTSPHLLRVNERIRLSGRPIPDDVFAAAYERVTDAATKLVAVSALPHLPSFFETVTAMAFDFFSSSSVDIAVLEVGLGGRLDATNVVDPILSVITDIDLDHQRYLGDTLAAIAREKAGIFRPQVTAITLPQHPEVNRVLEECMSLLDSRGSSAARNLPSSYPESSALDCTSLAATRFSLSVLGNKVEIVSPLLGRHQLRNLALAITAAEELAGQGFRVTPECIESGIRNTFWPCRFQRLAATAHRPEIILDGAHNPAGALALRSALKELMGERPLVLLFGVMADKDVGQIARILWPQMSALVLASVANHQRASSTSELAYLANSMGLKYSVSQSVQEGVELAISRARQLGSGAAVVIAGSIYLAGEAIEALRNSEPLCPTLSNVPSFV